MNSMPLASNNLEFMFIASYFSTFFDNNNFQNQSLFKM